MKRTLGRHQITRREALRAISLLTAGGLAACATPTPRTVEKVVEVPVEVTRIVEKPVEVTRAVAATEKPVEAAPTAVPPIDIKKTEVERLVVPTPIGGARPQNNNALIWYVDIEHEKVLNDPHRAPGHFQVREERTRILGRIAGVRSEAIRYTDVSEALAQEKGVRAIAISGNVTDWEEYDFKSFQPLFDLLCAGRIPVIGLCGGHQLIGLAYGAEAGPIRRLEPGEADDPNAGFAPGWFKEYGYLPVQIVEDDPLFAGLGSYIVVFESHYWEIKTLPAEFDLLASRDTCRVQVMRHKEYPIYGTQFHPEVHTSIYPDGALLLANFFRVAGILPPT